MKKIIILTGMFIFSYHAIYSQFMEDTLLNINFENGADSIIQYYNISGTKWQRGKPQKTILDSAFNAPNALLTDTVNPYLPNTYSYFEIPFVPNDYGNFGINNFVCPLAICFQHQSDWDSIAAGGWVSIRDPDQYVTSFDPWGSFTNLNGNSYFYYIYELVEIIDPFNYTNQHYDTLYNDTLGFRISHSAWKKTCINMYWIGISPQRATDTLYYRFSFQSDSTANLTRNGWMIDEIQIGKGSGICSGAIQENSNSHLWVFPNPADKVIYVSTLSSFEKGYYEIININGQVVAQQSIQYNNQIPIGVENLPKGVYAIQFNLDNKFYTKKLVKQ